MHVLFVQPQPCIRALKYAEGMRQVAPELTLSFAYSGKTLTELYGHGDECFSRWFPLGDDPAAALEGIVARHGVDLIHSHNAPDTLTNICIDLFRGALPIVHDIHDLLTARSTAYEDGLDHSQDPQLWRREERRAIEESDAIIAVSDEILVVARQRGYRLPPIAEVFCSYIPRRFVPAKLPASRPHRADRPIRVVYEGFLSSGGGHYDLREVFQALADEAIQVHVYPSRHNPDYARLGEEVPNVVYHPHLPPAALLAEIVRYDFGWAGFNAGFNRIHLDTVLPNKLFEYVACGLPVISFPHRALSRFLKDHDLGLVIETIPGISRLLREAAAERVRRTARRRRHDFTVEANLPRVLEIYERLLSAGDSGAGGAPDGR